MKSRSVNIRIGIVRLKENEREQEVNTYYGQRHDTDEKLRLRYKETMIEGEAPVPVMITAELLEQSVRIHRGGDFGGDMYFRTGERYHLKYNTPFGAMDMEIATEGLDLFISEKLFEADIKYKLYVEGELSATTSMVISASRG